VSGHASPTIDALQYSNWDRSVFEQWRDGGVTCVHVTLAIWQDARTTLDEVGRWNRLLREHADLIRWVGSGADIEAAAAEGRTGVVLGFQAASPFEDDLDLVQVFHQLGVRIVQLTYNNQSLLGGSCYEQVDSGLSRFGHNVVREMNRLGMLVDLSHVGPRTSLDAIAASSRPVAITHANPSSFHAHPRNKSDEVLLALAERGGVLGLAPYPHLTPPDCSLADWCAMAARTAELIGVEHVGIGSDVSLGFDQAVLDWIRNGRWTHEMNYGAGSADKPGWLDPPEWFRGPGDFPNLRVGLAEQGFAGAEVDAILGGNWMRVFSEGFAPAEATGPDSPAGGAGLAPVAVPAVG
jgi:microsomal dipeptidase-like Zn-dependent dipeptidase